MADVFVGDVGTEIVLDCGINVSSATVRKIIVKTPSGVRREWTAVADGTNSIKRTTLAGDLDMPGEWVLQAYVEMTAWQGHGSKAVLNVLQNL